jgi:hypothetical protein
MVSSKVRRHRGHELTDMCRAATSNAPQIGKKRRLSDDEDGPSSGSIKKYRLGLTREDTEIAEDEPTQTEQTEDAATAEGVKEVTEGVREVELEEGKQIDGAAETVPVETAAAVPLPDSPNLEAQPSDATDDVPADTLATLANEHEQLASSTEESAATEAIESSAQESVEAEEPVADKEVNVEKQSATEADETSTVVTAAEEIPHATQEDSAEEHAREENKVAA